MSGAENNEFDVGARLKEVRLLAGLNHRQLAERAGVNHGQISLLENNKTSPSVASLSRILNGIPMSLSEFFGPGETDGGKVFFEAGELTDLTEHIDRDGASAPINLRQVGDARAHNLQVLYERYAPGADTGDTMLEHKAHEGGIVVAGELEITVGSQKKVLKKGDGYLFDSRLPHRFRNISKRDATVVSACTPPYL